MSEFRNARRLCRHAGQAPGPGFGLLLFCGYDADPAGDRAARCLEAQDPKVRRMRPDGGKDWNEILRKRKDGSGPQRTQASGRLRPSQAHAATAESAVGANEQNAGTQPARETVTPSECVTGAIARSEPAGIIRSGSRHTPFVAGGRET